MCGGRPAHARRSDNFKNRKNKKKKRGKEEVGEHRERRKQRWNPDNSGTTQLLYHNRRELRVLLARRLVGANKLARSKEGRFRSFYLSINYLRILEPSNALSKCPIHTKCALTYYKLILSERALLEKNSYECS